MPARPNPVGSPGPPGPAVPAGAAGAAGHVEPGAVIADLQHHLVPLPVEADPDQLRVSVLGHVLQCFLRRPVDSRLQVLGQPAVGGLRPARRAAGTSGRGSPGWRRGRGRRGPAGAAPRWRTASRPAPRRPGPAPARPARRRRRGARDGVGSRGQVEEQADDPLADAVVDLAGQPAALVLLPLHHPLGEPLQRLFPLRQPLVQPGVLDGPGDQARHRAQQVHVGGGELAAQLGVHVEHAHQVAQRGHDRDRHHGGELLPAQRRDVPVPGVGGLVVHDHGGLAVRGHPAGHALADHQLDLPDQPVKRRRGAAQLQRAAPLVEQVHEADVGARWSRSPASPRPAGSGPGPGRPRWSR